MEEDSIPRAIARALVLGILFGALFYCINTNLSNNVQLPLSTFFVAAVVFVIGNFLVCGVFEKEKVKTLYLTYSSHYSNQQLAAFI
jgi:hypothetical protein